MEGWKTHQEGGVKHGVALKTVALNKGRKKNHPFVKRGQIDSHCVECCKCGALTKLTAAAVQKGAWRH